MAGSTLDALFKGPGIRTGLQHLRIMIGLENQQGAAFQVFFYHGGCYSQIRRNGNGGSILADGKT